MRRFLGLGGGGGPPPVYAGPISGDNSVDPYRPEDVLTVKHGANEYLFKYPTNTIATHALNVGHLRDKVAEITSVDVKRLSLICAGRQLKDDNVTLQTLGIEHGAKILAVGTNSAPPSRPGPNTAAATLPPPPKVKLGPSEKIEAVRDHVVATLFPLVDDFIAGDGAESPEKRADIHRRLGETIMGELLKLDGVETEDPKIRARRKEVVREIQGALDALDKALRESA
ncbi:BAG domain-containing protein [Tricharina praecox]|uniref:BAG domain-containing protein n=1 Tax=Tricharina praecox TaxID=43433 RepID=UPI00221F40F8|nr:BAG domain-containing protein [Tricharina praecox]KAI5853485.1 BAG domain-containing protein [Tricharina praecox]